METNEVAGLAITYRVERYMNGAWEDQGVAHRSPYGALMSLRALDAELPGLYRIADELMPLGRRVTPTKFSVEDQKLGPTWTVPDRQPTVVEIPPEYPDGYLGCC